MREKRFVIALLGVLLAALPACRAGQPPPQAPRAPLPAELQAWVGRTRLLSGAGDARALTLRPGQGLPPGRCDVAVTVRSVRFDRGRLSASLTTSGMVEGARRGKGDVCHEIPATRTLAIAGLGDGAAAAEALGGALLTPEAYLSAHGVTFTYEAAPEPPRLAAAATDTGGTAEERQLRRQVTSWPRVLLAVAPVDHDPRVRHEGEVRFSAVVGADGRLSAPVVATPLSERHDELVKRVLSLWRYEPARKGDETVAAHVDARTTLRIR